MHNFRKKVYEIKHKLKMRVPIYDNHIIITHFSITYQPNHRQSHRQTSYLSSIGLHTYQFHLKQQKQSGLHNYRLLCMVADFHNICKVFLNHVGSNYKQGHSLILVQLELDSSSLATLIHHPLTFHSHISRDLEPPELLQLLFAKS